MISECITSFIDGRVRLRHPALKNPEAADMVAGFVSGMEGVTEAKVNPVTGSLLIFYDAEKLSRETLLEMAQQGAAFLPEEEPCRDGKSLTGCCARMLLGRRATRFVDRAMFVSLVASLVGAFTGMGAVHRVTGVVFAAASLQHMAAHRKALC